MKKLMASTVPARLAGGVKHLVLRCRFILFLFATGAAGAQGTIRPSVTTLAPLSITATSAVLRGIINGDGGSPILERQLEWAKKNRVWGTGEDGVDFGIIADTNIIVSGNEFSALEIRLAPGTAYKYRALASNAFGWSDANVQNFTTTRNASRIVLSGGLDFGTVPVGESVTRTLTISNPGNAPFTVSSITMPDGFTASFSGTIEPGASMTVTVTFTPSIPAVFRGKLIVNSDAAFGISRRPVSGKGISLIPLPTATTLNPQSVTPTSALLRGIIDSDGGSPILERRIEWIKGARAWNTGMPGVHFGILAGNSSTINGNEFSATETRLKPEAPYTFRVQVRNAGGWATPVDIKSFNTPKASRIVSLSGDLAFGTVVVGESATHTLTIANSGNAPLSISSITFPDGFTTSFSGTIPPGGSNELMVTFTPTSGGPFGGTLTVNSDATAGTTNYFISGTGDAGPPVPVTIAGQPASLTARRGVPVDFSVAPAGGLGPLTFQWHFNDAPLRGATSPILHLRRVHPRHAGNYAVSVSDGTTTLVSSNATLDVIDIRILRTPRSRPVRVGSSTSFSVTAIGPAPLTYQWFFNGLAIEGATARKLMLENVQAENAGPYSVHVSNATGTLITPDATLGVR